MVDVKVEQGELDTGIPMMFRDFGSRIRLAYDPAQISEAAALVYLCLSVPRLAHNMKLHRL